VTDERSQLQARILSFLERALREHEADAARAPTQPSASSAQARDALLLELADYQRRHVAPYAHYSAQRLGPRSIESVADVPALPTDAFRFARISSRPPEQDVRTFRSSGTTQQDKSLHALQDLTLYDRAARLAARHALFPDCFADATAEASEGIAESRRMVLVILAPHERELPESSLSYMLARFVEWFGSDASTHVWPLDQLELERLRARLTSAAAAGMPVALLGTSFAFVHAIDALHGERFALPARSRIMQTGGFKGRSREVAADAMRAMLSDTFRVAEPMIVAEYGMTELSSQLYDNTLRAVLREQAVPVRQLWAPPWVRVSVVDPETLRPLPDGQLGLVRIDDLANLDSVAFIQTSDLGTLEAGGLTLHGRASAAVARGCSITADDLLRTGKR
jgi:acyl-CoA synthetase (AMP-forming)/AMP-acid ligase II